jgi:hypothetical protein
MYDRFIDQCDILLSNFKQTGDIEYMLQLEAHIANFLDFAVEDYLDEVNDSYIDENTSFSTPSQFNWKASNTL